MEKDKELQQIIEGAKTSMGMNGFQAQRNQLLERRDYCQEHGHRLGCAKEDFEKRNDDDLCICTYCEAWLSKEQMLEQEEYGQPLKFEPF